MTLRGAPATAQGRSRAIIADVSRMPRCWRSDRFLRCGGSAAAGLLPQLAKRNRQYHGGWHRKRRDDRRGYYQHRCGGYQHQEHTSMLTKFSRRRAGAAATRGSLLLYK